MIIIIIQIIKQIVLHEIFAADETLNRAGLRNHMLLVCGHWWLCFAVR